MSEVVSLPVNRIVVHSVRGIALWAVFGGLGACGSETTNEGGIGSPVPETQFSGQSGTEYGGSGGSRPTCPCGSLQNPLRATVVEIVPHIEGADGFPVRMGNVRLRVEELLGDTGGLDIGSEISGNWFGDLPCFHGCASVEVGDEVLAFYRRAEPCIRGGGIECSNGDTIAAGIALTPWADSVVLAELESGDFMLAVEDVARLQSPECQAQLGNIGDLLGPSDEEAACHEREAAAP